ncbi:unnamed protein product [Caenorhabditis sp. 36 PRJEB53466]|nr:unnamed protein product [Caenorhabditis sp. 36 PRJEB53466]
MYPGSHSHDRVELSHLAFSAHRDGSETQSAVLFLEQLVSPSPMKPSRQMHVPEDGSQVAREWHVMYKQRAQRLSAMVRAQPTKPAERLLKWSEFLAEFKQLENLEPAALKLNFLQYHSLDVVALLLTVVLLVLYVGYRILKAIARRCCCRTKNDEEKKKKE